jgi:hypothetical protein
VVLANPVIHLYWAYPLARAEEMFKVTALPMGVCGAQAEREHVTLNSKEITCPSCRERAKATSGSEQER